jgi:hypothetical protein
MNRAYSPAYLPAYPFGVIDTSNLPYDPNAAATIDAPPSQLDVAANAFAALGVPASTALTVAASSPAASTSLLGDSTAMPDFTMTPDWAAAAANGVSCWDYPNGVPVWVPGPYGSNPTGTPSTGPQCWASNAVPTAQPSPLPMATVQPLPTVVNAAPTPVADNQIFSPTSLLNPMPQIVAGPKAAPAPTCDPISAWVNDNPLLAAAILAAGFIAVMSKKGHRA